MKIIIELTDADGKTGLVEKVATCHPEGTISMTSDVFEEANYEQQFDADFMKDGRGKMEACLRHADACIDCGVYDKALHYYSYVLKKSVSQNRIIKEYNNLAERAFQGVVCCNSCNDEYAWEVSSEILERYRDLFKDNKFEDNIVCEI